MREILKETFDKIYCINLDSRTDKWELCVEEFKKYNILDLVERLPAIRTRNPNIGCNLSHIKCMELAKENNYSNILILEDDFKFITQEWSGKEFISSNPESHINSALTQIKNIDWDMLYFSYKIDIPPLFSFYEEKDTNLFQCTSQLTLCGYGIRDTVYTFILNYFKKRELLRVPLDAIFARYICHKFKCLNIKPMVIGQRNNIISDIRNKLVDHDKWTKKMLQQYSKDRLSKERTKLKI